MNNIGTTGSTLDGFIPGVLRVGSGVFTGSLLLVLFLVLCALLADSVESSSRIKFGSTEITALIKGGKSSFFPT